MTALSRVGALAGTFVLLMAAGVAAPTTNSKPVTVTDGSSTTSACSA